MLASATSTHRHAQDSRGGSSDGARATECVRQRYQGFCRLASHGGTGRLACEYCEVHEGRKVGITPCVVVQRRQDYFVDFLEQLSHGALGRVRQVRLALCLLRKCGIETGVLKEVRPAAVCVRVPPRGAREGRVTEQLASQQLSQYTVVPTVLHD